MKRSTLNLPATGLVAVLCSATWVNAGDLNPPPGAISPTNCTQLNAQSITLPYTISASGCYMLTSNFTGVVGQNGIVIDADNVTLDLNGFALVGVGGSLDAIQVTGARNNMGIRNGTVTGWGGDGVDAGNASNSQLKGLRASDNGGSGLVGGSFGVVRNCTAKGNNLHGISGSGVTSCIADTNGAWGIVASVVSGCVARGNAGGGISGSVVKSCLASMNTCTGISAGTATGCAAESNGGTGIVGGVGSGISDCSSTGNGGDGIAVSTGSRITQCLSTLNDGNGIVGDTEGIVTQSTASGNGEHGIVVNEGSTVSECVAGFNTGDGIKVNVTCRVVGNMCELNGEGGLGDGAGIHATLMWNRIEGNHVAFNTRGIDVDGTNNLITKNSATGNGANYPIEPGNDVGPIGSAATSTSPWANIQF